MSVVQNVSDIRLLVQGACMHEPKYTRGGGGWGEGGSGLIAFAQDVSIPCAICSASNTNRDVWEVGGRFD